MTTGFRHDQHPELQCEQTEIVAKGNREHVVAHC